MEYGGIHHNISFTIIYVDLVIMAYGKNRFDDMFLLIHVDLETTENEGKNGKGLAEDTWGG